eukprot:GCRY01004267.1.p1 GENE.GCRY01004267.1~~GCRY01004267.1.p1  ORF type:complete len:110 (+),score=7.56 GCRY01004267.1:298-627(+)
MIPEIFSTEDIIGKNVRIIGTLINIDIFNNISTLEYKGSRLDVDVSLLQPFDYKKGDLLQIIGEVGKGNQGSLLLSARVCRCVNGLDCELYEQALGIRRQFLKSLETQN